MQRTLQRLDVDNVETRGNDQIADEIRVFLDPDRGDRHLGTATHEVEQRRPQCAGKPLMNQFERGHAPTDDPFLAADVVGAYAGTCGRGASEFLGFAGDTAQQRIDLFLGKDIVGHPPIE